MSTVRALDAKRMVLAPNSLRVWRAVAARGVKGVGSVQLYDSFEGQLDRPVIKGVLNSLRQTGYVRCSGHSWSGCWQITTRIPLGEAPPQWLVELASDGEAASDGNAANEGAAAIAADAPRPPPRPVASYWPPIPPPPPARPRAVSRAGAQSASDDPAGPLFTLDSAGRLTLRADGIDGRLSAHSTRALLRWLEQLGGAGRLADAGATQ